jgi:hypothetical protein
MQIQPQLIRKLISQIGVIAETTTTVTVTVTKNARLTSYNVVSFATKKTVVRGSTLKKSKKKLELVSKTNSKKE